MQDFLKKQSALMKFKTYVMLWENNDIIKGINMGSNKIPPASIWGSDEPWVIVHPTSKDKITRFFMIGSLK